MSESKSDADGAAAGGPRRIQRQRTKGWRMPENTVYVGRPSRFGNPFVLQEWFAEACEAGITDEGRRRLAVRDYRDWLLGEDNPLCAFVDHDPPSADDISVLRGKNLACWCPLDQPCHADVLLEIANGIAR